MSEPEKVRTLHIRPYRKGIGMPWFRVEIWDSNTTDQRGAPVVYWRLYECYDGRGIKPVLVFDGLAEPHKWRCSGWFSVDGDEAAECVLKFASLQPGDTDPEFFEDYSPTQIAFVEAYGEAIDSERECRFPEEV